VLFTLQNKAKKIFGMKISPEITQKMAFLGKDPVRCKIIVDNKCLQQIRNFKYLRHKISYEKGKKMFNKELAKFFPILGIIHNNFKPNWI
jgi:hypothetical protein